MKEVLLNINSKIEKIKIFNRIIDLAEKIEKEGKFFPALFKGNGEYERIDPDKKGSICYWRLNGDINYSSQENTSGIGLEYKKEVPLKFIGYLKKEKTSDQYFTQNIADTIISEITSQNIEVKQILKAKKVSIVATKTVIDPFAVEKAEYEVKTDSIRYTDAYFSIDFTLTIVTNSQCYISVCSDC